MLSPIRTADLRSELQSQVASSPDRKTLSSLPVLLLLLAVDQDVRFSRDVVSGTSTCRCNFRYFPPRSSLNPLLLCLLLIGFFIPASLPIHLQRLYFCTIDIFLFIFLPFASSFSFYSSYSSFLPLPPLSSFPIPPLLLLPPPVPPPASPFPLPFHLPSPLPPPILAQILLSLTSAFHLFTKLSLLFYSTLPSFKKN